MTKFEFKLKKQFKMYDLELTMEMSEERITMLDLEIYILDNKLHTKESRKETAANSYLHYRSAHPTYAFKGIIKSQLFRIRRLCSREEDFAEAVESLKLRCLNSGYDQAVVEDILKEAQNIPRSLQIKERKENEEAHKIRWITTAHSTVEEEMENFVKEMNASLKNQNVMFELIKTTAPTLGKCSTTTTTTANQTKQRNVQLDVKFAPMMLVETKKKSNATKTRRSTTLMEAQRAKTLEFTSLPANAMSSMWVKQQ